MKKIKFCRKCGKKLVSHKEPGTNWRALMKNKTYRYVSRITEYDEETGQCNFVDVFECPNRKETYKNFWGNEKVRENEEHEKYATHKKYDAVYCL